MNLLAQYLIKVEKSDSTGDFFNRIAAALAANGYSPQSIRFLLEDSGFRKISPVQRAVKAIPRLGHFRSTTEKSWEPGKVIDILTNLDDRFKVPNREGSFGMVETAALASVAEGIPNPFPFWDAMFLFDDVALLDLRADQSVPLTQSQPWPIRDAKTPSIFLGSSWGRTRRNIEVWATLLMTPPPAADSNLPPLPVATKSLLESLGRVHRRLLQIIPNVEELRLAETQAWNAGKALETFKADHFEQFCRGLRTPPANIVDVFGGTPQIEWKSANLPSAKTLIVDAFKPLGFRYNSSQSGQGCYELRKRSKNNLNLEVSFDLSPMMGQLCGSFSIRGLSWGCPIGFRFPGCRDPKDVPIVDEAALRYAIELSRLQAEFIEKTLVPEIDRILGPLPAWWESGITREGK